MAWEWPRVAVAMPDRAMPSQRAPSTSQRSPAPSQRLHSTLGLLLHCSQRLQQLQPRRREPAITVEGTSSRLATPSPPQHSTATPATRCVHPCSLTVLGKPQRRAQARRSPAANPVVVATPPQSTSRYASCCARFPVVRRCLYERLIEPPRSSPAYRHRPALPCSHGRCRRH